MAREEAALDLTNDAFMDARRRRFAGDDRLTVQFTIQAHPDEAASEKEGRPIYTDREYITIMVPGDKDNMVFRPVRATDKQRFAAIYRQFQANEAQVVAGTPLDVWPGITRAQVEELKYFHVRTVEQLVGMPDSAAQGFRGMQDLRNRAKLWLEAAQGNAVTEQLNAKLKTRDDEIAALKQAVEEQSAQIKELMKGKK